MSKDEFFIERVTREESCDILQYHYLGTKGFRSGFNYGLFKGDALLGELLGVCIFTNLSVPELAVGLFGLDREDQEGLYELSRLCVYPSVQDEEHNIASWFVARCIKGLRKDTNVRAILAYADSEYHQGTVYRALNFDYYGLTDLKSDFWSREGTKHGRGKVRGVEGEWRQRSRKHRYLMIFDESLVPLWKRT